MSNRFKKVITVKDNASKLHSNLFKLLQQIYPYENLIQEFPIKINRQTLFIDVFAAKKSIAFEANGVQHSKYVPFFHESKADFKKQQDNDALKELWCKEQNVTLVKINYDESLTKEQLQDRIIQAIKKESRDES